MLTNGPSMDIQFVQEFPPTEIAPMLPTNEENNDQGTYDVAENSSQQAKHQEREIDTAGVDGEENKIIEESAEDNIEVNTGDTATNDTAEKSSQQTDMKENGSPDDKITESSNTTSTSQRLKAMVKKPSPSKLKKSLLRKKNKQSPSDDSTAQSSEESTDNTAQDDIVETSTQQAVDTVDDKPKAHELHTGDVDGEEKEMICAGCVIL